MRLHISTRGKSRLGRRPVSLCPSFDRAEPRVLLSAAVWTGGAGDNNWNTAGNWNTDSVPIAGEEITFDGNANITVPVDLENNSVDIKSGTVGLVVGGTSTGTSFTVESGATLFLGGTWSLDAASSMQARARCSSGAMARSP